MSVLFYTAGGQRVGGAGEQVPAGGVSEHGRMASIVKFWRSVELFSTQVLDPVDERQRRFAVNAERDVPWLDGHRLQQIRLDDDRVWRHTVYGGVFALDSMYETLEKVFGPCGSEFDERIPRGQSAVFAVRVTADGRMLLDSLVITTAAWAVGRAVSPGPDTDGWLDEFDAASDQICGRVRAMVAAAEDDMVAAALKEQEIVVSRPIGATELLAVLGVVVARLGIDEALQPVGLRVHSEIVGRRKATDAQSDLLNSFYAPDLERVADAVEAGDVGAAVATYLSEEPTVARLPRRDVRDEKERVLLAELLAPSRTPIGRWPAKATHPLATSQQLAINTILEQLGDTAGVFGVNGPPGTGKTTMLRDLIAAVIVQRAQRLAKLARPADAFTSARVGWGTDRLARQIRPLRAEFTGFEMVVASANNGAVENIVKEVPLAAAIDDAWTEQAGYFVEHASRVHGERAWGLIAAALGNKRNREDFANRFWWPQPTLADTASQQGFLDWLKSVQPDPKRWPAAVTAFNAALKTEEKVRSIRQRAHDALLALFGLQRDADTAADVLLAAAGAHTAAARVAALAVQEADAAHRHDLAMQQRRREHLAAKPGIIEILFTFGRAIRRWHVEDEPLAASAADAYAAAAAAAQHAAASHAHAHQAAVQAQQATVRRDQAQARLAEARALLDAGYRACGDQVPDQKWWNDEQRREVAGPWLDEQWNAARTRVFLAALDLHAAFIADTARILRPNLHAIIDILTGKAPPDAPGPAVRAAWQSLFLVVPVISTTFASAHRLFGKLGREALGWLLIDEAGQAAPQAALGAMWRARRVVAVGDPLQLDPIVGVLHTTQERLRRHHHVTPTWLPGRTSVQRCADRVTTLGTTLTGPDDEDVWVGAPLRVHRRCDEPIFDIVNDAVYQGLMIHAAVPRPDPLTVLDSAWIDVASSEAIGNWIPEETAAASRIIKYLISCGVKPAAIMAISPFRDTARELAKMGRDYPQLTSGTVNKAQGKEADVVLFVLGGNPGRQGARGWAASRPNLFNVAVSRAKQRLYVIGNHHLWSPLPYYRVLAATLERKDLK